MPGPVELVLVGDGDRRTARSEHGSSRVDHRDVDAQLVVEVLHGAAQLRLVVERRERAGEVLGEAGPLPEEAHRPAAEDEARRDRHRDDREQHPEEGEVEAQVQAARARHHDSLAKRYPAPRTVFT